jgi:hypothetical protein
MNASDSLVLRQDQLSSQENALTLVIAPHAGMP